MSLSLVSVSRFAASCSALVLLFLALVAVPAQATDKGRVGPNAVPTISVDDVSITEGNSGAKTAVFTVSLSAPSAVDVGFMVGTAEVSAVGNDDFQHYYSSPYSIPAGQTTYTLNLVIFGDTVAETNETFQVLLESVSNATVVKGVGIGTIVNDDAGASPTLMVGDQWTTEGNSGTKTANFTVQLSQPAATDVSFSVATANGTASAGSDYTALNLSNQVIPAGQLVKTVSVTIAGDTSSERDETFTVNLSNVSGAALGRSQGLGTIGNDDNVSAVKISVGDVYVDEGNSGTKTATFYVSLSQAAASTVTFDIKTEDSSATAASGDYVARALVGQTIAAGLTSKTFTVTVNGDTTEESEERFIVTLANISNASLQYSDPHGVATIPNDDATMSIGDVTQLEGTGNGTAFLFPVTVSAALSNGASFQIETFDGTATAVSGDYNGQSLSNWQIPSGQTSANVVVWVGGDSKLEPDETFTVRISNASVPISDNEGTGTILNDDAPPFPSLQVHDVTMNEGNSGTTAMNFPITLSEAALGPVSFDLRTQADTATANVDYVSIPTTRVTIPAGETRIDYPVLIKGDLDVEYIERFYLIAENISGGSIYNGWATGTITNDDVPVVPTISIADITVTESDINQDIFVPVTLSAPTTNTVSYYVSVTDGTAIYPYDYNPSGAISIPPGQTNSTLLVTIKGDLLGEPTEDFHVVLYSISGATAGDTNATVTILDNDGPPGPSLSISDVSIREGKSDVRNALFTVSLSQPATVPVTFNVATADETAFAPLDYTAIPYSPRTIAVGETTKTISVPVFGDPWLEDSETFSVGLYNVVGANPADVTGRGTIINDDLPAGPKLSIGDMSLQETSNGLMAVEFTISLSQAAPMVSSFDLATVDGSALAGSDYEPISAHLYMDAGQTSKIYTLYLNGDTNFEPDEYFRLVLSNPQGGPTIGKSSATVTILNDDAMTGPLLSIGDASVAEGNSGTKQASFTVSLSQPAATDVSFDVSTGKGTATADLDYLSNSVAGKVIPAGQTSTSFAVTINGDTEVEANETYVVNLGNVVGANLADAQGLGTIGNDDQALLSIADVSLAEGDSGTSTARFELRLSQPMPTPVSFDIATSDGSALAGSDYVPRSQPGRVIDAGRTRAFFEVEISGDALSEPDESFNVALSNVAGATLGDGSAVGTLVNDDGSALVAIADIQGKGPVSPLLGQTLDSEGVVTAVTPQGFFLQSLENQEDGDPSTAEGLFVSSADAAVAVGDLVRVGGEVQEVHVGAPTGPSTLTRIAASTVSVLGHGRTLPRAIGLQGVATAATQAGSGLERFEGMRIRVSPLTVLAPSGGRIDERTSQVRGDGRFYAAVRGADGRPERLAVVTAGQRGGTAMSADSGDIVTGLVGVLGEGSGGFELLTDPSAPVRSTSGARPAAVSAAGPSVATIGNFNLRRFFDSSRAANEPVLASDAYATRLAKSANAVCAYAQSPAILAVREIENATVLDDLAAALNSRAGNVLFAEACRRDPVYVGLRDGLHPGSHLGLLVSAAPVRPGVPRVEARSITSQAVAEDFAWRDGGREPLFESAPLLVQARINGEGGEVLELALLLAESSDIDARADTATHGWATRADYLRARSEAQARVLARVIRAQQRAQPRQPLVVLTDLQAPLAGLGLTDLTTQPAGKAPYSVLRDGKAETLDRVLVGQALMAPAFAPRLEFARINADFGEDNYSDNAVPVRVSDHDPVVLFLQMH